MDKLFIVEFGVPSIGNVFMMNDGQPEPVYVMAKDWNMAAEKGLAHVNRKKEENPSVVDEYGDLVKDVEIKVSSVSLACEEYVK
jgi:hypothetical protein